MKDLWWGWLVMHQVDCWQQLGLTGKFSCGMSMEAFALIISKVTKGLSPALCFILTRIGCWWDFMIVIVSGLLPCHIKDVNKLPCFFQLTVYRKQGTFVNFLVHWDFRVPICFEWFLFVFSFEHIWGQEAFMCYMDSATGALPICMCISIPYGSKHLLFNFSVF